MLDVPENVWQALGDSHVRRRFYGLAQYQARQVELQLDTDGDVSFTSSKGVQSDASILVVGQGESLVPRSRTDMLAPYGQEVSLFWEVQLRGDQTFTIQMGVFRITDNDGGTENIRRTVSRGNEYPPVVVSWQVGVELADRFRMLDRAKLVDPKSPQSTSMWAELQRLALFPLLESLPDAAVPASMAYDERLSAVWDLAALANGVPALTRQGALTLRLQDRWLTETVPDFTIEGAIEFGKKQSDNFYNYVWAHSDDNEFSAFAILSDDSDPRSVNRAGPVTYEHSSPAYTTVAAAQAGANTILHRLLNRRSEIVTAVCGPQAMVLEVGDFGLIKDPRQGRQALGEVSAITVPNDPTSPVTVELIVAEET